MQLLKKLVHPQSAEHGRYYVYVLYITLTFGREYWLYVGKGSGNRVNVHIPNYRTKLKKLRKLDSKERLMLFAEDLGYEIHTKVLQSGLSEDEAYNLEGEVMRKEGLLNRGNEAYPHRIKRAGETRQRNPRH